MKRTIKRAVVIFFSMVFVLGALGMGMAADLTVGKAADLADFNAKVDALLDKYMADQVDTTPYAGPKAVKGKKKIVNIAASLTADVIKRMSDGVEEACAAMGWEYIVFDTQWDPNKMTEAVEKAIAMKADAVLFQVVDASWIIEPLRKLKKLGIPTGGLANKDVEEDLYAFDAVIDGAFDAEGYVMAMYNYSRFNYNLKTIMLTHPDLGVCKAREMAYKRFVKECKEMGGDCTILADQPIKLADLGPNMERIAGSVALRSPGFNSVFGCSDTTLQFAAGGLRNAGLLNPKTMSAVGVDADPYAIVAIRKDNGLNKATCAFAIRNCAWSEIDDLNRIFAGEKPLGGNGRGVSFKLITKDNVPSEGNWEGDFDAVSKFRETWGK